MKKQRFMKMSKGIAVFRKNEERVNCMKSDLRIKKQIFSIIIAFCMAIASLAGLKLNSSTAAAATIRKCYTINTGK